MGTDVPYYCHTFTGRLAAGEGAASANIPAVRGRLISRQKPPSVQQSPDGVLVEDFGRAA